MQGRQPFSSVVYPFLSVLLGTIFSVISGIVLRVKDGQSCPWPLLAGLGVLVAVLSMIILVSAVVQGWL